MRNKRKLEDWPPGLRLRALALDAERLVGWAAGLRETSGEELCVQEMAADLGRLRRNLATLPERASPLAAAVLGLEHSLAVRGDIAPGASWLEADVLADELAAYRLRDLPSVPGSVDAWESRVSRLAALPWIKDEIWNCPAGWLPIFERAAKDVEQWIASTRTKRWRTRQIKEKLGTLRWYVDGDEQLRVIVAFAEETSGYICQACGQPGKLRSDRPWILTLCDDHHAVDSAGGGPMIGQLSYPERPRSKGG